MRLTSVRMLLVASALATLFTSFTARADLRSAHIAYDKHDFDAAFVQFKDLAVLGQPQAQYALAILYFRGEGVDQSNTYAHAWASLAAQNGESKGAALAAEVEPQLTPNSLRFSSEIQAQYSQTVLNAHLLPTIVRDREYQERDRAHLSKPFAPGYPPDAQQQGVQGEVYVEFIVARDGHPRLPRILYAVPTGFFEAAVRESVLGTLYLPARINGTPISSPVSMFYHFKMDISLNAYGTLEERIEKTKLKAEEGDPGAQMLYGMMIAGLPQLKQTYSQALPWFLKAAQAGAPYAQYQIGTSLLQGRGCECDNTKGEIWLQKAAQSDQPDAQVSLAEYLLREKPNHEGVVGALVWLERAAKQGNNSAKLLLSAILAANPASDLRDPSRALKLVDGLEHEYKEDPSFWEIRAAANAARGDFKAAVKAESRAMIEATRLGWNLDRLEERRSTYVSQKSWSGDLLDF
jgi:uncharacterized protein